MSSSPWDYLAGPLAVVCDQFRRDRQANDGGFLPGSAAALEAEGEPYAGDWGPRPGRNANMAGLFLADVAMDHVSCLAALLRAEHVFGPTAVARSAMEAAARGFYLLEPDIAALERIRRQQNERLVSLTEGKRLAEAMKNTDETDRLHGRLETVLRSAPLHDLTAHPNGKPAHIGAKPPSATDLIDAAVARGDGLGSIYYKVMSAVAHGREHGTTQYFSRKGALLDRTLGDAFGVFETDPKKAAQFLAGAPFAAGNMLERLYRRFGWPSDSIRPAIRRMRDDWVSIAAS